VTTIAEMQAREGEELGVSRWLEIDQARIDAFADLTEDWQYIHVDPEKAKASSFGTTIAHGFLTLSMMSRFAKDVLPRIDGVVTGINYGMNRLRNVSPVRVGARIRGRFRLLSVRRASPGRYLMTYDVTVEIEGQDKPALVAEWLSMLEFGPAHDPQQTEEA
jgi:acyl dehydratase